MRLKWLLAIAVIAALVGTGVAFSQNPSQPAATPTEKVKTISKREWNKMKGQWAKQTDKWESCNKQADDQKLSGTRSEVSPTMLASFAPISSRGLRRDCGFEMALRQSSAVPPFE